MTTRRWRWGMGSLGGLALFLAVACARDVPEELLVAYTGDCQAYLEPCG